MAGETEQRSSMERFLTKLRELLRAKFSAGNVSEKDFDEAVGKARGHIGGVIRGEKLRAEREGAGAGATEAAEARQAAYARLEELPANVRGALPEPAQKAWMAAFNAAMKSHPGDEKASASIAWGAVKSAGYHPGEGGWTKASEGEVDLAKIVAAVEASEMGAFRLLGEVALSEDGKTGSVQIFPRVGTYQHPKYGELKITPEFLAEVKRNFDAKCYQQDLPLTIDLEHQTALSGAAGWVKDIDIRGNDGAWAQIEFNDRGKSLVAADAYRYFSPEYYDKWQDPGTGKSYSNLLIGGALTNRPFFKGMDPVMMGAEGVFAFTEIQAGQPDDQMDAMHKAMPKDKMMAASKSEEGENFPAEAYLYVPDTEKPSTWKLRVWESVAAKVTRAQLGAAAAALGPGGFRGEPVQIPAADKAAVIAKLRGLYAKLGVKPEEMPAQVRASLSELGLSEPEASAVLVGIGLVETTTPQGGDDMGMTEEEARKLKEMGDSVKSLSERVAAAEAKALAEETARKAAEAEAKAASEQVAMLTRAARRKQFSEVVEANRLGFPGLTVEAATDRLEGYSKALSQADFDTYLAERKAQHEQMRQSAAFQQLSTPGLQGGGAAAEFTAAVNAAMAADKLDVGAATAKVASENPQLYNRYDREMKARATRGGD